MQGPLCRAVTTYSTHHVDQEGRNIVKLLGSSVDIECVELSFDEADEATIIEDGGGQQNHFVMFGIMQVEDTGDRPFYGIILRLTGLQRGQYRHIGAFRVDDDRVPQSLEEQQEQEQLHAIFGGDPETFEQDDFGALKAAFNAMDMPDIYFEEIRSGCYEFTII